MVDKCVILVQEVIMYGEEIIIVEFNEHACNVSIDIM